MRSHVILLKFTRKAYQTPPPFFFVIKDAWPRDSCTAAVALVTDRLQDHLQTMFYNAPRAYWACATVSVW